MSVCDVPVISEVCQTVGEGTASLVAAPFDWLAQAMGGAASWLFKAVWGVFDSTTFVDVTSAGYLRVYNLLFGVAIFVMLLFFCLQLLTGLVRRDPTALMRAALGLAKSILGSFVLITLTGLLLELTDQLCIGVVQATGNTMQSMGDRVALLVVGLAAINVSAPGVGAIITIFLAGLAIAAAAIVWFSLLVRKSLLLVAIVFGPIALAGLTWDATKGWFGKYATFVVAMIVSKLVLTVIFLVAVSEVAAPITPDLTSLSDPIAGIVLMFMAAFAPYMVYKFLSFVGFDMNQAMSMEQEAKGALNRPIPMRHAQNALSPKKVLGGGDNGGSGGSKGPGGGGLPPSGPSAPSSPAGTGAAPGGATASGAAAGNGAGAGSSGAASAGAGGAAAAAGPAAAAVIAAELVKKAATAGPKAGQTVGDAAFRHAYAAASSAGSTPTPVAQQPAAVLPPSQPKTSTGPNQSPHDGGAS